MSNKKLFTSVIFPDIPCGIHAGFSTNSNSNWALVKNRMTRCIKSFFSRRYRRVVELFFLPFLYTPLSSLPLCLSPSLPPSIHPSISSGCECLVPPAPLSLSLLKLHLKESIHTRLMHQHTLHTASLPHTLINAFKQIDWKK